MFSDVFYFAKKFCRSCNFLAAKTSLFLLQYADVIICEIILRCRTPSRAAKSFFSPDGWRRLKSFFFKFYIEPLLNTFAEHLPAVAIIYTARLMRGHSGVDNV